MWNDNQVVLMWHDMLLQLTFPAPHEDTVSERGGSESPINLTHSVLMTSDRFTMRFKTQQQDQIPAETQVLLHHCFVMLRKYLQLNWFLNTNLSPELKSVWCSSNAGVETRWKLQKLKYCLILSHESGFSSHLSLSFSGKQTKAASFTRVTLHLDLLTPALLPVLRLYNKGLRRILVVQVTNQISSNSQS